MSRSLAGCFLIGLDYLDYFGYLGSLDCLGGILILGFGIIFIIKKLSKILGSKLYVRLS
mgnify:CR=1 FL=1